MEEGERNKSYCKAHLRVQPIITIRLRIVVIRGFCYGYQRQIWQTRSSRNEGRSSRNEGRSSRNEGRRKETREEGRKIVLLWKGYIPSRTMSPNGLIVTYVVEDA